MNYHYPQARLLIFAKAPVPGQAKTRLIPLLGAAGAAELQAQLLQHTVVMACDAEVAPVELWMAGEGEELLEGLRSSYPIDCFQQRGADLGERMFQAVASGGGPVVIIGTDCPVMEAEVLQQAFAALENHSVVFQPAEDGGYTLLGLRKPYQELFRDINWGSSQVLEQSLQRVETLGLEVKLLAMAWDIDRPEDYQRAMAASLVQSLGDY